MTIVCDREVRFVFSTVHKFKGLEMDNVRLLDDFSYQRLPYSVPEHDGEEFNLLYVALTRAKKRLMLNDALYFLMTSSAVDCCYEEVRPPPPVPTLCVLCGEEMTQYHTPAVLWQQPLTILDSIQRSPGYLCSVCAWAKMRRVCHTVGGRWNKDPWDWKVRPGIVHAGSHAFLRRILSRRDVNQEELVEIYNQVLTSRPRDLKGCELGNQSDYTVNNLVLQLFGDAA